MNEVQYPAMVSAINSTVATSSVEGVDNIGQQPPRVDQQHSKPAMDIDTAVTHMNEFLQAEQRDLQFSVDDKTGSTVVKVMDRHSGETIRQIPNEVFLDLAHQAISQQDESLRLINVYS